MHETTVTQRRRSLLIVLYVLMAASSLANFFLGYFGGASTVHLVFTGLGVAVGVLGVAVAWPLRVGGASGN